MTLKVASFHGSLEPKLVEIWKNKWHVSDTKIIQTTRKSSYFAFIRPFPLENKDRKMKENNMGGGLGGGALQKKICDFRSVFDDFLFKNIH